ncbi:hypothetical protein XELAEV_18042714mg, partial [Xenopus laevis]
MGTSLVCIVTLFSLLIPVQSAPDLTLDTHWQMWVKKHQKTYKDVEEERARRTIWEETLKFITVHNLEYSLGLHTYDVGMNHLGDMTGEEVAATMTGCISLDNSSMASMTEVPKEILEARPHSSVDWRTRGCVTRVKNQRSCGSCYAFGAVGALECQWKKRTGRLVSFSPQELVDCSSIYGNNGCNGGHVYSCFKYMRRYGLMTESTYPYKGKEGRCKKRRRSNFGMVRCFYRLPYGNEKALKNAVGRVGPVSVYIDAGHEGFRMYKS